MDLEEGELAESDEELPKIVSDNLEVYTRLERPVAPRPPVQPPAVASDEDVSPAGGGSSSSDSDGGGGGGGRKRPRPGAAPPPTARPPDHNAAFAEAARRLQARRARLSVWTSVLAEDGITADLAGGLGQLAAGPRIERDVESYQLPEPRPDADTAENPRKRGFRQARQGWRRDRPDAVHLEPLEVTEQSTAEQVSADIALKLLEDKPQIIDNVVRVIGVKKSIDLFEETKSVEEGGGMLVNAAAAQYENARRVVASRLRKCLYPKCASRDSKQRPKGQKARGPRENWSRRRTPGGVFIQLLKTDPEVTEDQVRHVFRDERRQQERERKVLRRRRRRDKLARLAAAAGSDSDVASVGTGGSADASDANSEAAPAAGEGAHRPDSGVHRADAGDAMCHDEPEVAAGDEHAMAHDELEVADEIIFE